MTEKRRFMDPHEVPTVPGTEGWEEMYCYYHLFNREEPKRAEYESSRFWFRDKVHHPEPMYPLDPSLACDLLYSGISAIINRAFKVPVMRCFDFRILNGFVYLDSVEVENQEEMEQRAQVFGPRINQTLQNWDEYYRACFEEADSLIEEMKKLQFAELIDVVSESEMHELPRSYPVYEIYSEYLKFWDILVRMGQQTLKALLPSYGTYLIFIENMKKLFPDISDNAITRMVQGFDSKLFRPVEELQKLAQLAVDTNVHEAILKSGNWVEVSEKLKQSDAGKNWLEQFEGARNPWFEMSSGEGWQKQCLSWNDNLDIPLVSIKNYITALKAGESITRPKEAVIKERDRVTEEYRGLIKNEEDAKAFERLISLTRKVAPASEDHNMYHGSFFHSLYDRKIRQLGKLLVNHGFLEDKEDVFLLNRQNLDSVVWELYTSWCRGLEPAGKYYWPKKIQRRKEIIERFHEWVGPPALGQIPEIIRSPFAIVLFGITRERIESWLEVGELGEEKLKELKGFPASSGMVEGTARVCRNVEDIGTLKPGDIMVTPSTAPTWAPAFQMVSGCVTDMGGVFCHTAIVAREYGLPAVVGTGYATSRIKTGDRIRIDGDNGVVEILERAE